MARGATPKKKARSGGLFWKVLKALFVVFVMIPVLWVALYRFVPPPVTLLMAQRGIEGKGLDYRWRSLRSISPHLVNAAIAAEDARFCSHRGFDFEAIEKAMEANERGGRLRGGSTISQQTAKNVFLWPQRSWVRKGFEAYFTTLIELVWGKRRIMEVYLNVAEMGPGIYGAEAAAQAYFGKSAADLTPAQAARIAAILPSPLRYRAVGSGPYVERRSRAIGESAVQVRNEGLSACVLRPGNGARAPREDAPSPARRSGSTAPAPALPEPLPEPAEPLPLEPLPPELFEPPPTPAEPASEGPSPGAV